jgi:glycosyltransferase involved in cell wall biosynthesis
MKNASRQASGMGVRAVLHVLPHPGGGGETYVDMLSTMASYRFERAYLARGTDRAIAALLVNALRAQRAARTRDLVHVHGEIAAAACMPALATRPSVVTLHGMNLFRRCNGLRKEAARLNLGMIIRSASRTICVSRSEQAEVIDALGAWASRRVVMIPNGVAPAPAPSAAERDRARAALGLPSGVIAGLCVGALEDHKDPLTPVRAALGAVRAGAPLVLLVAGDGPLRAQIEQELRRDRATAVRLLGHQPDLRPVLAAVDFFVLASKREGLSFALLEAMALGLPPVVSDAPGNAEAAGDAGVVVPFGDVSGFASAFARISRDGAERAALGERARARIAKEFHADEMRRRTAELYNELTGATDA